MMESGREQGHENGNHTRLGRTPKEGERILEPTRRPDGTYRKPIRIRAGYTPQDEIAIYQSKGTLLKKSAQQEIPPGFDAVVDVKPKSKSVKRNERKKEKKLQAALALSDDKGKTLASDEIKEVKGQDASFVDPKAHKSDHVESLTLEMNALSVNATHSDATTNPPECSNSVSPGIDLDKKIRNLKKKIRLVEAQQNNDKESMTPEQSEKQAKVVGWRKELKILEHKKEAMAN